MEESKTSSNATTSFTAVIPAAGIGSRMQSDVPKQYLKILGRTIIEHTIERLIQHPRIDQIVVALHPDDQVFNTLPIAKNDWLTCVVGGNNRCDSVLNGLQICQSEWVLVHDAARPCVRLADIERLLALANTGTGGILARKATDTMKRALPQRETVDKTEDRNSLWHALTPQFFPTVQLRDALNACAQGGLTVTDEASAIEQTGGTVTLVEGAIDNIKVTLPLDMALAEFYLTQQSKEQ